MNAVTSSAPTQAGAFHAGRIQPLHLDRQALVYVRQSTMQQVERHQESTRLQYALVERAQQLGWARQRIEVIDDDLGVSGASIEGRPGFQRLVAEVGLDHVGIVLGIEMSRLARSSRDWYQLLEVCSLFATLLGDQDGIYDPSQYNDRLLLGLKGTMSEAELHILKQRMLEGRRAKARRGELGMRVPMGYVCHPSGEVVKDPDEQAQAAITAVFEAFERHGTLNGVLRFMVEREFQLPCRLHQGARKGELEWHRPNRTTLDNVLHHPVYAGAYVYGRRPTDPRKKTPGRAGTGRIVVAAQECDVLLKGRRPAYISWEQYERNVERMQMNAATAQGTLRQGPSLLSGLLVCGRCGLRMTTQYSDNGRGLRYTCSRMATDYGEALCQSLSGKPLDQLIARLVLQALEPAALEISLDVAEDLEAERARHHEHWNKRLERTRYDVERAHRQYDAVEPESRLVARTLERHWEQALAAHEQLELEHARFLAAEPATLTAAERESIRQLATDIPALWQAETTTGADRQSILRQLAERVLVTVIDDTENVNVEVHWLGGHQTQVRLVRPVSRLEQLSYYDDLLARVAQLHRQGEKATAIARTLNAEAWRPPKRRSHEWTLNELACELDVPSVTLYKYARNGTLKARREIALTTLTR